MYYAKRFVNEKCELGIKVFMEQPKNDLLPFVDCKICNVDSYGAWPTMCSTLWSIEIFTLHKK